MIACLYVLSIPDWTRIGLYTFFVEGVSVLIQRSELSYEMMSHKTKHRANWQNSNLKEDSFWVKVSFKTDLWTNTKLPPDMLKLYLITRLWVYLGLIHVDHSPTNDLSFWIGSFASASHSTCNVKLITSVYHQSDAAVPLTNPNVCGVGKNIQR